MRAYVFTDASLSKHAGRFVWLAINGEEKVNAPFRRKYRIPAFPTYYLLDPRNDEVIVRWIGSASVAQLDQLFQDQSAAYARRLAGAAAPSRADATLRLADSLYAADAHAEASAAYARAVAEAPADWSQRARAVDARLFALSRADSAEACVRLAEQELARTRHTTWFANVAASGLACAIELPKDAPNRAARIAAFEKACEEVLADSTLDLQGDDRSGVYIALLESRDAAEDEEGRHRVAEAWSRFLDGEAAKAKTPVERAVFDPHRLSAYIESGHAERAIPMLELSQKEFPEDYNPVARLAITYRELKRWDEGLAASDRALAMSEGPRRLTFYPVRADLYLGKGDREAAKRTIEEALAYARALPEGQRSQGWIRTFEKRLAEMGEPAPAKP